MHLLLQLLLILGGLRDIMLNVIFKVLVRINFFVFELQIVVSEANLILKILEFAITLKDHMTSLVISSLN